MITSFKLPDLVLGVNIRADVTGARQAARQLRNAVASEFARAGGMGAAGAAGGLLGGSGGGLLAPFLGGALGSMIGTRASGGGTSAAMPAAQQRLLLTQLSHQRLLNAAYGLGDEADEAGRAAKQALLAKAPNAQELMRKARVLSGAALLGAHQIRESGKQLEQELAKQTATGVGKGTQVGLLKGLRKALRLWHFLIGGLITGFIVGGVKRMLSPALQYIRNTGTTTGRYGRFSNAMEATPSALRNVNVQFGLMAIQLLNLDDAMQGFNRILVQTGSVMAWLGEQKWLKAILLSHPNVLGLRALNWALGKLPTGKGGVDLGGGGFSGRMAPAALQGSVEAYRIIQGNLMNYAAATARNTKQTVDALNKIIERAPVMGVVAG